MGARLLRKIVCIVWLAHGLNASASFTVNDEISLKNSLLNNTGMTTVRPEKVTLVELSFNLLSINTVDIKNEVFGVSGWWSLKWRDERLNWVRSGFTGIPVIQVYNDDIWTPALVVDNSVNDLSAIDEDTIPLRVRQDGEVTWNPPGILLTSCEMTVTYFPFDTQTCVIQVTSFGYTIQELNISVHTGLSQTYFQLNGEWNIIRTWNERYEYNDGDYDYAKVAFYVELKRRAVYYGLNTMLPVLLNSLLIPMVFLLPHDAGEKIGYCLTALLAYVVILTIVTDGLPTTAKSQSLLGVYIALVLSQAGIAVVLAIHSLHIFHRDPGRPVPGWQGRLTRWAIRIMRCKCTNPADRTGSVTPVVDYPLEEKGDRLTRLNSKMFTGSSSSFAKREIGVSSSSVRPEVSVSEGDVEEAVSWHLVAQAYDAFFFRLYLATILCCSVGFMLAIASNSF
ncbi:5-hydroxytryptamine receptor 3A-like [Babylonia areolata]|uniref:5-hydroxytryptamine receptor 3A-like n=1 Tax=Babylonia areolata TaxID=304850 RepID=UPI003FD09D7A